MEAAQEFITVDPDAVGQAGRSTAATTGAWRSWGNRTRSQFDVTTEQVVNSRLARAFGDYAAQWQPKIQVIAEEVVALGVGTTSAANTVDNGDVDSAAQLGTQTALASEQGSLLSRPINGSSAAV
ncbi:hypothetical protein JQS43_17930 [Natronosporangium hydrolyticum]|uniref:Uncharacterized protein n=1 Tax=Natronosporangium hydrolyticum TaxID=2811111 RepID=A0A895YI88_9ACTN|nr:hypothetical protein [Natronosporangium hydrolyticum]QSB13468.1 hypothetical protein JQS43_17930 [Natronosporangium hydrolyticum]